MTCEYLLMYSLQWRETKKQVTLFKVDECFVFLQLYMDRNGFSFFVILFIHTHLYYRDNADDFIAAHRLSDMLVKINLDETASRNQGPTVGPPPTQMRSVHGRPSEFGTGKNLYFTASYVDFIMMHVIRMKLK